MASKVTLKALNLSEWQKPENTMESLVARSYIEIPYEERNELLNELHGISEEFRETPQLVQGCLDELEKELRQLWTNQRMIWLVQYPPISFTIRAFGSCF
jgi:hypothetical protein